MTTLEKLIERLEKATGPDREIDAEIMFELYATPVGKEDDGGPSGYLWPKDDPSWSFGIRFPGKDRAWFADKRKGRPTLLIERDGALVLMNDLRIPLLTTSLDAAMSLVPEGHFWFLSAGRMTQGEPLYAAEIFAPIVGQHVVVGEAEHEASAALALCLASLKALNSRQSKGE